MGGADFGVQLGFQACEERGTCEESVGFKLSIVEQPVQVVENDEPMKYEGRSRTQTKSKPRNLPPAMPRRPPWHPPTQPAPFPEKRFRPPRTAGFPIPGVDSRGWSAPFRIPQCSWKWSSQVNVKSIQCRGVFSLQAAFALISFTATTLCTKIYGQFD